MYYIEVHSIINRIVAIFCIFGVWQKEDEMVVRKIGGHLIYIIFSFGFTTSLIVGAVVSNSKDESLFLVASAITAGVISVRGANIHSKKRTILSFLHDNCSHSFTSESKFNRVNKKLNKFMDFVKIFILLMCCNTVFLFISPAFLNGRSLPLNIGFPWNWRSNIFIYCIAYAYIIISVIYNVIIAYINIIIWYLMINNGIKYKMLGDRFMELGVKKTILKTLRVPQPEEQNSFDRELIELFKVHQSIQRSVTELKSFFSCLFFIQILTSSICICGSVYVLTFPFETPFQFAVCFFYLIYSLFEIFMLMYFGNDIKLSSNRLSYCLFESNWIEQPKSTKMCMIILAELLQQPHELIVGKLYQLDLKTFTAILRLAYSMFNILRNYN